MEKMMQICRGCLNEINPDTREVPAELPNGYHAFHCPVGIYEENPYAILVGKTAGWSTFTAYRKLMETQNAQDAARTPMFSNLRDNLYRYLDSIGFFTLLQKRVPYWETANKAQWDELFSGNGPKCGLTLTQACSCCVVREREGSYSSNEPDGSVFRHIDRRHNCLLRHVQPNTNTRLMIFLDTPANDGRFHSEIEWKNRNPSSTVRTISITHPSSQNNAIYTYLPDLTKLPTAMAKMDHARALWLNAKRVVEELQNE